MEDFKKDIDSNTIVVGDFNTLLSKMDISSEQNVKDIVTLNNVLDQMDLTDIYRESLSSQRGKIHIIFKYAWKFFKDHMMGHKTSFNKFKKIENGSSIFSDHKGLKLETNLKEKN